MIWLIAEDELDIRVLISTMFQVWGKNAVVYENGQKVWEWLDTIESGGTVGDLPELILMDIRMPGKKGNEIANRMRKLKTFDHTPIVLMTAFALSESEKQEIMTNDGVDHIIYKPLPDFDQLRVILHDIVDNKRKSA
ncbi:response regulator [Anaerolineae bacterium CFX9]|nr:response regulator [Anaerolineae bacterium CFX9]